jgi:hypothetical protein
VIRKLIRAVELVAKAKLHHFGRVDDGAAADRKQDIRVGCTDGASAVEYGLPRTVGRNAGKKTHQARPKRIFEPVEQRSTGKGRRRDHEYATAPQPLDLFGNDASRRSAQDDMFNKRETMKSRSSHG